jgi:hypothetical protein
MNSDNKLNKESRSFLLRRYEYLRQLVDREKVDQEPCYYKEKYGDFDGFRFYYDTVIESVIEFIFYSLPDFDNMEEVDEIRLVSSLKMAADEMFFNEVEEYYFNNDCGEYHQNLNTIYESKSKGELKRLRRIQEVRDIIEFQTEIQDPHNFDDGEEYADFCIGEGLSFFYGDEGYEREDDIFKDEDEDHLRDEISSMMYEEFFDYLVGLWNDSMSQEIEW